jgi:hypothetical protein
MMTTFADLKFLPACVSACVCASVRACVYACIALPKRRNGKAAKAKSYVCKRAGEDLWAVDLFQRNRYVCAAGDRMAWPYRS